MRTRETVKVIMLPTKRTALKVGDVCSNNVVPIFIWTEEHFRQHHEGILPVEYKKTKPQDVLFLSKEKPEKGDWCVDNYNIVYQCEKFNGGIPVDNKGNGSLFVRKIIASTNRLLTPTAWINDSFKKAYVEQGGKIEEVQLEKGYTIDKLGGHFHQTREYFIKTREDKSVIVYQSKAYTLEQVEQMLIACDKNAYNRGKIDQRNRGLTRGRCTNKYLPLDKFIVEKEYM